LVEKVKQLVVAIDVDEAKPIMPTHYTGWVPATHGDYRMIEQAGLAVGALKAGN
jgi:phosphonate transport system substrate-binding protein